MVKVKLFGVVRLGTGIKETECEASGFEDVFIHVRSLSPESDQQIDFGSVIIFVNGKRITKKKYELHDGDEVWLMSPASGG